MVIDELLVGLGFDYNDKQLKSFNNDLKRVGAGIAKLSAVAVAGAAALAVFVNSSTKATDALGKMAEEIGVAVSSLDALGYAATIAGGSSQGLQTSLRELSLRSAEAAQGLGTGIRAFNILGVSVNDTSGELKSADVLLLEVSAAMQGLSNSRQIELADKLGLRESIRLLRLGPAEIKRLRREVELLGVTTEDDVQVAGKFQDSMTKVYRILAELWRLLTLYLAPVLTRMANGFINWWKEQQKLLKSNEGFISSMKDFIALDLPRYISNITDAVKVLAIGLAGIATALTLGPIITVLSAVGAALGVNLAVGKVVSHVEALTRAAEDKAFSDRRAAEDKAFSDRRVELRKVTLSKENDYNFASDEFAELSARYDHPQAGVDQQEEIGEADNERRAAKAELREAKEQEAEHEKKGKDRDEKRAKEDKDRSEKRAEKDANRAKDGKADDGKDGKADDGKGKSKALKASLVAFYRIPFLGPLATIALAALFIEDLIVTLATWNDDNARTVIKSTKGLIEAFNSSLTPEGWIWDKYDLDDVTAAGAEFADFFKLPEFFTLYSTHFLTSLKLLGVQLFKLFDWLVNSFVLLASTAWDVADAISAVADAFKRLWSFLVNREPARGGPSDFPDRSQADLLAKRSGTVNPRWGEMFSNYLARPSITDTGSGKPFNNYSAPVRDVIDTPQKQLGSTDVTWLRGLFSDYAVPVAGNFSTLSFPQGSPGFGSTTTSIGKIDISIQGGSDSGEVIAKKVGSELKRVLQQTHQDLQTPVEQ